MYIKNSTGRSTEPWGIPLFTGYHEDLESLITTLCCRPERKSVTQFKVLPITPYCLRTPISLLRGTESKAFLKSKYITSTISCLSIALVKSSITSRPGVVSSVNVQIENRIVHLLLALLH